MGHGNRAVKRQQTQLVTDSHATKASEAKEGAAREVGEDHGIANRRTAGKSQNPDRRRNELADKHRNRRPREKKARFSCKRAEEAQKPPRI